MAILDTFNTFSTAQAVTVTAVGTDSFDTKSTEDIGVGEAITFEFTIDTSFASGTSIAFEIVDDDNAALSSPTTLESSGAILTAALTAGRSPIRVTLSAGSQLQRYIGVQYTVSGTFDAGAVSAYVVQGAQASTTYVDHGAN